MNNHQEIEKIINEIKLGKIDVALISFDAFLLSITDSIPYSKWSQDFILKIYEFGALFTEQNPEHYFEKLEKLSKENEAKREIIDFMYSEIAWNYFSQDKTYVKDQLKDLKKKYPTNPEFYHSYSHILDGDGSYKESLQTLEQAIRIDPCHRFITTYINRIRDTFNKLVSKNHLKDAEFILDNAVKTFDNLPNKNSYTTYTNILPQLQDRLKDHRVIEEKISKIDDIILKRTEALRNRFISMLGVFTAIIAFILTTVNIAIANLKIKDIMLLMLSMADVLIIFVISIDYVFYIRKKKKTFFEFLTDKQFWGIIILLVLLYILFKAV